MYVIVTATVAQMQASTMIPPTMMAVIITRLESDRLGWSSLIDSLSSQLAAAGPRGDPACTASDPRARIKAGADAPCARRVRMNERRWSRSSGCWAALTMSELAACVPKLAG
jgi:hypothetical protein